MQLSFLCVLNTCVMVASIMNLQHSYQLCRVWSCRSVWLHVATRTFDSFQPLHGNSPVRYQLSWNAPTSVVPHFRHLSSDPSTQIRTYDAGHVLELPNCRDQELTSAILLKFTKQSRSGGPWRCGRWLRGLHWLSMAWRCSRSWTGTKSERQQLDRDWWGCDILKEARGLRLARLECLVSWGDLEGVMRQQRYCWTLKMIEVTCLQLSSKCLLLKLPFLLSNWIYFETF